MDSNKARKGVSPEPLLLRARWLVLDAGRVESDGAVLIDGGLIAAVEHGPGALRRLVRETPVERRLDLEGVLAPGLVDAHAHLDLTGLAGAVPARGPFVDWIRRLIAAREARSYAELAGGARQGARRLLETGTTSVGDVDSLGLAEAAMMDSPLRLVSHRELLDAGDPARSELALETARDVLQHDSRGTGPRIRGLSPHAPYTASPELLAGVARLLDARPVGAPAVPLVIHWAETEEENNWLRKGRGPFAEILAHSPLESGLELIEGAGLLGRATLVHGNCATKDEIAKIAASGVAVVHCPGTHQFFGRAPFPLAAYRDAGVPVALGTDSLASNDELDMRGELSRLRAAHPALDPRDVMTMATENGARALGLEQSIGRIAPGWRADLVHFSSGARGPDDCLDELTAGIPAVQNVWIDGLHRLVGGT